MLLSSKCKKGDERLDGKAEAGVEGSEQQEWFRVSGLGF